MARTALNVNGSITAGVITGRTLKRISYDWQEPEMEDRARSTV
jgi:L-cystine uptake protein TcyP (sodium:dicarboxylate symporter family)